ncbi:nocturnin-like [Tropilaelaps mercedesae]|uniref:Nocturnin-like n=1 Tax=Tropilaelaps mercedesae TaxID=418985 RepID=A0A1V9Y1U7_9ACAR|nr:nocturnin-like [Tropilaelaps mercedesae]
MRPHGSLHQVGASFQNTIQTPHVDPQLVIEFPPTSSLHRHQPPALVPLAMGSLAGRAKILSEDSADQDVESEASASTTSLAATSVAEQLQSGTHHVPNRCRLPSSRLGLLERCRQELATMPPMIVRAFVESNHAQHIAAPDTIRVMQWNILAQCECEFVLIFR